LFPFSISRLFSACFFCSFRGAAKSFLIPLPGLFLPERWGRRIKRAAGKMPKGFIAYIPLFLGALFLMMADEFRRTYHMPLGLVYAADAQKQGLIENFPIPNAREDMLEFLTLAVSKISGVNTFFSLFSQKAKTTMAWNEVWTKKCKQVLTKARISTASDPHTLEIIKEMLREAKIKI
jgi:hypothetical protein